MKTTGWQLATMIVDMIAESTKFITIKWIYGHVRLLGNENADELAKKGTEEEVMEYKLQWIDVNLKIDHENSASKGKFFYEICPELLEKLWYAKCRLKNDTIRMINRVFTSLTFTKDRQ
jgi:hypothetical protein